MKFFHHYNLHILLKLNFFCVLIIDFFQKNTENDLNFNLENLFKLGNFFEDEFCFCNAHTLSLFLRSFDCHILPKLCFTIVNFTYSAKFVYFLKNKLQNYKNELYKYDRAQYLDKNLVIQNI